MNTLSLLVGKFFSLGHQYFPGLGFVNMLIDSWSVSSIFGCVCYVFVGGSCFGSVLQGLLTVLFARICVGWKLCVHTRTFECSYFIMSFLNIEEGFPFQVNSSLLKSNYDCWFSNFWFTVMFILNLTLKGSSKCWQPSCFTPALYGPANCWCLWWYFLLSIFYLISYQ